MKNFYIFLDFDGTMTDTEHIKRLYYQGVRGEDVTKIFKPESIEALNYLIDYLNEEFDVHLVISSIWRKNMEETLFYLKKNNIKLDKIKTIDKTEFYYDQDGRNRRDKEIKQYLKEHNETENFVAIDDEATMFNIPSKNKIKTFINDGALNKAMVIEWIEKFKKIDEDFIK